MTWTICATCGSILGFGERPPEVDLHTQRTGHARPVHGDLLLSQVFDAPRVVLDHLRANPDQVVSARHHARHYAIRRWRQGDVPAQSVGSRELVTGPRAPLWELLDRGGMLAVSRHDCVEVVIEGVRA